MRNLYELFRDGVIDDAVSGTLLPVSGYASPLKFIPDTPSKASGKKLKAHVGRLQTMALVRRFMHRASSEFPGGILLNSHGMGIDPSFVEFAKTHREMGSSVEDMRLAWSSMVGMKE